MIKKSKIKNNIKKKFFTNNFRFYKEKKSFQNNLLFVDRERIDTIFQYSILSLALSEKYKSNITILSDQKKNSFIFNIYRKLGFINFVNGYSLREIILRPYVLVKSLFYFFFSLIKTYFCGFDWFINNFKINNIIIGDLIYDANIRYNHRFINPRIDLYFIKLLFSSICRFFIIKNYLVKLSIKKILVGTETGPRNNGLALRISSKLNIKNYTYFRFGKYGLSLVSYKKNYYQRGIDSISKKQFIRIAKKIPIKKINDFYNKRKKNLTSNWYIMNDFKIANKGGNEGRKFINFLENNNKQKILFACHAFADAPHAAGQFIFKDYFEQFVETLNFANKNDQYLWIFKPHPNSRILNEKKIFKKKFMNYKKKNILLCPATVPIQKLINICDVIVTGRGTIGMESAALGKTVIIAGSAPYSDLEIAFQPKSKKEYFNFLRRIKVIKKNKSRAEVIKIAKQLIYIYENSLNVKTIKIGDLSKDSNYTNYLKKVYSKNFDINKMFKNFDRLLSDDITKSSVYNKLKKIA